MAIAVSMIGTTIVGVLGWFLRVQLMAYLKQS